MRSSKVLALFPLYSTSSPCPGEECPTIRGANLQILTAFPQDPHAPIPSSSKLDIITVSRFTIRLPKSLIYPQRGLFRASHLRLAIITSGSYLRFSPNLSHKTLFSHPLSPYFSYICVLPSLSSEFHTPIPVCIDGRVQVSKNLSLY